jgi:hypothetical protein
MKKILWLVLAVFLGACSGKGLRFDGKHAFQYLEAQCDLGPRNPGAPGHGAAIPYFTDFLKAHADTVILQAFNRFIEPDSITLDMTNIIAGFNLSAGNGLLIGAHWDTRPRADHDPDLLKRDQPILGANDGASGVAVLMHLAEILSLNNPHRTVFLVLFDGEDYGYSGSLEYYCMGSEYFARNLPISKPAEAIILDMIGDADLVIPVERNSFRIHPGLVNRLWELARQRKFDAFVHRLGTEIYDDHLMLFEYAGIPAVDIIDFSYPNDFVNYWHTTMDTPDKCSPRSLEIVGQVILDYLFLQEQE